MTVREAPPQDAAEVAGVHVRSWQVAYRGLFPDDYLDGLRAEERMAHYPFGDGRPGSPTALVAVIDATIRGFVVTGPARDEDAADAGEVYAIYVDPQAWGRGIGRSLIAEARTRLSSRNEISYPLGDIVELATCDDANLGVFVVPFRLLSRQGFPEAALWAHAGNEEAQRFYRADGWQSDGHRRQEYVRGALADEVRYRRCLP